MGPGQEGFWANLSFPIIQGTFQDVWGYWTTFFHGIRGREYSWRWYQKPFLYYPAHVAYTPTLNEFVATDSLGRVTRSRWPFECTINPNTGKYERLCVQTTNPLCVLENSTWDRTVIRNVTPKFLRFAVLPLSMIPRERRTNFSNYTRREKFGVVVLWIVAVVGLMPSMVIPSTHRPRGKSPFKYLKVMYKGVLYPRLAGNPMENRQPVAQRLVYPRPWASDSNQLYRTLRPRMLCYVSKEDAEMKKVDFVPPDDITPYVFIAYTTKHFDVTNKDEDMESLFAYAQAATLRYAESVLDPNRKPGAFWLSHCCTPEDRYVDSNGKVQTIEGDDEEARLLRERLRNEDIYSISDVIRAAEHVIVIAGNPKKPREKDPLREWGERVWTLPEIILSRGDSVSVVEEDHPPYAIDKMAFASLAWDNPESSRQLLDHFTSLYLSRLELVKIALECVMDRSLNPMHSGDRSYVLMGLLRVRPPIDENDSSFQAFARLSLPHDSDRLMERVISLLPNSPEENWESMGDQFNSTLWDIHPDTTQVCGIGENDTLIVDGCKGALIQWSQFSRVQTISRLTITRQVILYIIMFSPLLFFIGCGLTSVSPNSGVPLLIISLVIFQLPAPFYIWHLFGGKLYGSEPCLFGLEGYVPLGVIEDNLFGSRLNRLSWSPNGSPLSRHEEGEKILERQVLYPDPDKDIDPLLNQEPETATIDTYHVKALDPCAPCEECKHQRDAQCPHHETVDSVRKMSENPMGKMKIFTIVDTLSMTVTLFKAVRPPAALIITGSEGGMKRALACSFDITSGTFYRETVLRLPSQCAEAMHYLPRIRLGLKRPFLPGDVRNV